MITKRYGRKDDYKYSVKDKLNLKKSVYYSSAKSDLSEVMLTSSAVK